MPVVQITINQKMLNPVAEVRNVFYMEDPTAGPDEVEATAQAIITAYEDHLQPVLVDDWQLYGYTWRNVSVAQSQGVEVFVTPFVGANNTGEPLPYNCAALVSFRTGTPPPNTGRKYIAGMPETGQNASTILANWLTALQAWGNAIVGIGSGVGFDRPLGAARINPQTGLAEAFNPYSTAIARSTIASMRSRRPGVGI